MSSLNLYVHERSDETLVVALVPLERRSLPRTSGVLAFVARCSLPGDALSPHVQACLREEGYCAVVGRDAQLVRATLQAVPEDGPPPQSPPPATVTAPIWVG